ncbi:hypothetical protein AKJ09_02228 [Labilithrix luteola]|uniref:Uncharacterized protein n=1 Tax=Labilithrix luteola TaxID=1391654 RepID=A0A0K1PR21_9BACT|nr:hypothetical protein AKJ09_02228 [Labilithrix luteola]
MNRLCPATLVVAFVAPLAALTFGRASLAHAEPADIAFTWNVPDECPSRAHVLERVGEIAGGHMAEASHVEVDAKIVQTNAYAMTITIRRGGEVETRRATSASCAALGDAAAIIVALALDPSRGAGEPAAQTPPSSSSPLPPGGDLEHGAPVQAPAPSMFPASSATSQRPPPAPSTRPSPASPVKPFGLRAGAVFDVGTLPAPVFGVEARFMAVFGPVQLGLGGELFAPVRETYSAATGAGARFQLFDLGAFGCFAPTRGPWRVGACAGADATWMTLEGIGVRVPSSSTLSWPTVRAGALAEYTLTHQAFLFARADAVFALADRRAVLTTSTGDQTLHEVPVLALRLALGLRANIF